MTIHGTITSLEDFNKIISEIRHRRAITQAYGLPFRQEFCRGQLDVNWLIKPSLTRNLKTPEIVEKAENEILELFKKEIEANKCAHRIFLHNDPYAFQNDWAWLSQAQHYGIPTRLLDWTLKPEVALYFAVDNSKFDDTDGQFLVMYVPINEVKTESSKFKQYFDTHPKSISETWFLNPSFYQHDNHDDTTAEVRRARQHGKFTMQTFEKSLLGLDEQKEFHIPWHENLETFTIEKYIIPANAKPQLRLDLISDGWHGEFLYANDDPIINSIQVKCKQLLSDIEKNGS
ncbi:MAG: FRG domain-containing protein [Chitinophagaceae bacterium]|nr:FRG domain-containing protein [Chitinophagaceae bacterium]